MTSAPTAAAGTGTFPHGIHPLEGKQLAEDVAIEVMPTPAEVRVALLQHLLDDMLLGLPGVLFAALVLLDAQRVPVSLWRRAQVRPGRRNPIAPPPVRSVVRHRPRQVKQAFLGRSVVV